MRKATLAVVSAVVFTIPSVHTAFASDMLSADQVKSLVTGNTVDSEILENGKTFRAYFDPSGTLYRLQDGKMLEGSWRVQDDGSHCITLKKEFCAQIRNDGDGSYTRIENGSPKLKWHKFTPGRDI